MKSLLNPWLGLTLVAAALYGCNEDQDRYENIDKLRAIGAATLPVVSEPSTEAAPKFVTITVFAAVPLGQTVTAEPYEDKGATNVATFPLTIVPGSEVYEEHATFRIFSVKATQPVPPDSVFLSPLGTPPYVRLRYGIRLVSGDESENIVGNSLIYPSGSPELARVAPTVAITKPAVADVSGTEDLEATITDSENENMRVGWFASDGPIKNRRAKTTEWETPGAGPAMLIVTIRGRDTGAFAFKVLDVNVQ